MVLSGRLARLSESVDSLRLPERCERPLLVADDDVEEDELAWNVVLLSLEADEEGGGGAW